MPLTRPTVASAPLTSGALETVTPPAPTSEAVASGGSVTGWTFSAFTDPDSRIDSYSATLTAVVGSGTLSGSGLGPYGISGTTDGDAYTVELDALDGDGAVLATATHSVAIAAGATVYALELDGIDMYGEIASIGNVPASLEWDPTQTYTIAQWVRVDANENAGLFGVFNQTPAAGFTGFATYLRFTGNEMVVEHRIQATLARDSNQRGCVNPRDVGDWILISATVNTTASSQRIWWNDYTLNAITPPGTTPTYALCGVFFGTYNPGNPTSLTFQGALGQLAVWSTDETANMADIYAAGQNIDWSTLTNPPDVLHYRIGADDDPTAAGGIQDRTGNGLHMTLVNGVAGSLITLPQPRW